MKIALLLTILFLIVSVGMNWLQYQENLNLRERLWEEQTWLDPAAVVTEELYDDI